MGRLMTSVAAVALLASACGSAATSAAPSAAAPAPTATAAPATATPTPAASATAIAVKVTFDGKTCTYAGPSVVPSGAVLDWSMENTPEAFKSTKGAGLIVLPVAEGTSWDEIVGYTSTHKSSEIPDWALVPGSGAYNGVDGLGEMKMMVPVYPQIGADGTVEYVNSGQTMTTTLTRAAYYVGCHTSEEDTDWAYPGALLQVITG